MTLNAPLVPFEPYLKSGKLQMEAEIKRESTALKILFELRGDIQNILFPSLRSVPTRLDALWQKTCFEAFLTWEENPFYFELNASPSGDWNFYRFDEYRKKQSAENSVTLVKLQFLEPNPDRLKIAVWTDLVGILPADRPVKLQMGVAAVIEWQDHQKTYWAIKHPESVPDFHSRNSFVLEI